MQAIPGKGIASSSLPYKRTPPTWLMKTVTPQDVEQHCCKLAKKGLTPSQIGVILRDSHGIPQVRSVTGSKILRLLKKNGLAPAIPEDLYCLIKKAVAIRKHLDRNRPDKDHGRPAWGPSVRFPGVSPLGPPGVVDWGASVLVRARGEHHAMAPFL